VRTLQIELTRAGFPTPAIGIFGPITQGNVRAFERRYRLRVNGIATVAVLRELALVLATGAGAHDAVAGSGGSGLTGAQPVSRRRSGRSAAQLPSSADPTGSLSEITAPVVQDGGSEHLGERILKPGMTGHDVRVLQGFLTLVGYPTAVDGSYGPATEANVIAFQQANSLLPADGVVTYQDTVVLRQLVAAALQGGSPERATLNPDGTVTAPADAPKLVQEVIAAANQIIDKPYIYAGGHASWKAPGYDCSGAVSYALHGANLLESPEDSTELESYGSPGPGRWITIYADAAHTFIVVAGLAFDTAHYGPTTPAGTGPRWLEPADVLANLSDGGDYVVRHPSGL
ncbi:MAG TPA: peptidoglycan-binding domain-containing protein, partial [Solirubrobacteraceae bacterium]|nr:peptidoglycan-binding domain-containing protein [Solirubrobacteraceae bacterium]